jgi:hypothetical protein
MMQQLKMGKNDHWWGVVGGSGGGGGVGGVIFNLGNNIPQKKFCPSKMDASLVTPHLVTY